MHKTTPPSLPQKVAIWKTIETTLTADIGTGQYRPGDKLPTEADLSRRFGVNRHTIRRALRSMAETGLVISRRGSGVFVAQNPTDYPIGRRVRFHQNLKAAGRLPAKKILSTETRQANPRERGALKLAEDDLVHCYEGLSLSDGQPIALFRSIFPAKRFPSLLDHLVQLRSVTEALKAVGVEDYTRVSTRMTAKLANPTQALHLQTKEGAPILRTVGINEDTEGHPIEYGHTWFAGDRVTLTLSEE